MSAHLTEYLSDLDRRLVEGESQAMEPVGILNGDTIGDGHDRTNCAACNKDKVEKSKLVRARPDRRRPKDNYGEAMAFIAIAMKFIKSQGHVAEEQLDKFRPMFTRYAKNTGLRGKQRASVWRIVSHTITEARKEIAQKAKKAKKS